VRKQALVLAAFVNTWAASAQVFTGLPPAVPPLTGAEQLPADTGGSPPSVRIKTGQLAQFVTSFDPGTNWLIAGDATQNLWQRGVNGPYITSGVVFGPDRWAYWSAGTTPVSVGQDLTPGNALPGFGAAYRLQRQAGATGTDQICVAQEISTQNSVPLQGKVVEVDFGLYGGAGYSVAPFGGLQIYVVTGTGTDEGVGRLAFGINGGGGSTTYWTGSRFVVAAAYGGAVIGQVAHPVVVAQMPSNVNEAAVVFCYHPTGTAGANDFVDFSGVQMRIAPAMAPFASPSATYVADQVVVPPFTWRLGNQEVFLQESYYWERSEGAGLDVIGGPCLSSVSLRADCFLQFPVPMGKVPTLAFSPGFATDANSGGITPCTGLAMSPGMVATQLGVTVGCATGVNVKTSTFLYENGGSGMIAADAELN
jgi:hypothetical protein